MENVVTVVFSVESEAYKAFSEMKQKPAGENYTVAEAALLKREAEGVKVVDLFDAVGSTSDDTTVGLIVGSIVGILGGPLGVLLGASYGAIVGGTLDAADAVDSLSMAEVTATKLFEGETAIIALVQEEEPAFDAALEGYETVVIRRDAETVLEEVESARELEAELARQARLKMRSERKVERKAAFDERVSAIKARFAEIDKMLDTPE